MVKEIIEQEKNLACAQCLKSEFVVQVKPKYILAICTDCGHAIKITNEATWVKENTNKRFEFK